jgi:uncharacterized protein YbjQ (UPF0145 family)
MDTRYNITFDGQTAPARDIQAVKDALMRTLRTDGRGIEMLFTGKPVIIKRNVDAATAQKYEKAFEAAGAICTLDPVPTPEGGQAITGAANAPPPNEPAPAPPPIRTPKTVQSGGMIITNIETVPGRTIVEHFGLVSGSTIRAKHVGRDIMASLKNIVGGELKGYTQLMQESRKEAADRMVAQARQLGANAVVNVRFSTSSVAQGAAELYAYGTAVRVE